MQKNFSILKWIIFPLLVVAFGAGILYVSIKVFTLSGSVPSIIMLLICLAISLVFVLHTSNHKVKPAKIAAFTFECLGVSALGITLVCSVIVLREFSGASETIQAENKMELAKGAQKIDQIKALSGIKSKSAQATLAKDVTKTETSETEQKPDEKLTLASVYAKAEKYLLWPLIGEACVYLIGLLVVFGLVEFLGEHKEETNISFLPNKRVSTAIQTPIAPFVNTTGHSVTNGNGFFLSLSPQGDGVSIRFRERGFTAKHAIRIKSEIAKANKLETLDYKSLAEWTLATMEAAGKTNEIYHKIKESL